MSLVSPVGMLDEGASSSSLNEQRPRGALRNLPRLSVGGGVAVPRNSMKRMSQHYWALLRRGILAVAFWKKEARRQSLTKGSQSPAGGMPATASDQKSSGRPSILASEQAPGEGGYELGSLGDFLDVDLPIVQDQGIRATSDVCESQLAERPQMLHPGARRRVIRRGDMASKRRINGARHLQIRSLISEGEDDPLAGSLSSPTSSPRGMASGPVGDRGYATGGKNVGGGATNFTLGMAAGLVVKPIHERHPLLASIEGMLQDDGSRSDKEMASMSIARRLDELRNREARKGPWTLPPERVKKQEERGFKRAAQLLVGPARPKPPAVGAGRHSAEDFERLFHLMDHLQAGSVPPDALVPTMLWLGSARRRVAALSVIEFAFGHGDRVDKEDIAKLANHSEAQLRLHDGLRRMARRESLEQTCEFITDKNRLREWFTSMDRDRYGRVGVEAVQNLFVRMEITTDRKALFRLLHALFGQKDASSPTGPASPQVGTSADGPPGITQELMLGFRDFCALLGRCVVTWCLDRVLTMIEQKSEDESGTGRELTAPGKAAYSDRHARDMWTTLQRKIVMSLLVNHRFWGRESRQVLAALNQPALCTFGQNLSPEQWLSLFQRVRAQNMASTFPEGDEVDDPDFLLKRAEMEAKSKEKVSNTQAPPSQAKGRRNSRSGSTGLPPPIST